MNVRNNKLYISKSENKVASLHDFKRSDVCQSPLESVGLFSGNKIGIYLECELKFNIGVFFNPP